MRDRDGPDTDLGARSADQRRHRIDRVSITVSRHRGAQRVVAVEAGAGVHVELGAFPRPDHGAALRADDRSVGGAAVRGVERADAVVRGVRAQTREWCAATAPTRSRSAHRRRRSSPSPRPAARVEPDAFLGVIQGDFGMRRCEAARRSCSNRVPVPAAEAPLRNPRTGHQAVIDLFDLIAVHGIVEIEREIGDEVEIVGESERRLPWSASRSEPCCQSKPSRVA